MSPPLFPREIYHQLRGYTGSDAYADVIGPWLGARGRWLTDLLAPLAECGAWRRDEYVFGDLLEQAYALGRVNDLLLLGVQPPLPEGLEQPWAHAMHLETPWPEISLDEYTATFTALGMATVDVPVFEPFFHEIVTVEQAPDPDHPIEIVEAVWPCLMLGQMLFSRAGVRVRAGTNHAVAGIAGQSTLHEVFLRRHRPSSDMSFGWGHNSQWKTDFRRDYLTTEAYNFNIDGRISLNSPDLDPDGLTVTTRRELLQHRCLVRDMPQVTDRDSWPGDYRLAVSRPS